MLKYTSKQSNKPIVKKSLFEKICKGSIIKKNNQTFIGAENYTSIIPKDAKDNSYYLEQNNQKKAKLVLNKSTKSIKQELYQSVEDNKFSLK